MEIKNEVLNLESWQIANSKANLTGMNRAARRAKIGKSSKHGSKINGRKMRAKGISRFDSVCNGRNKIAALLSRAGIKVIL